MKKIIVALLVATSLAHAEQLNFNSVFHSIKTGVFLNQHYQSQAGLYTTVVSFHDGAGLDLVDLNAGYLKNLDSSKGTPLAELGLRLDNLLALALRSNWGQNHVSVSPLPSLEAGPFVALGSHRESGALKLDVLWGAGLSIGF